MVCACHTYGLPSQTINFKLRNAHACIWIDVPQCPCIPERWTEGSSSYVTEPSVCVGPGQWSPCHHNICPPPGGAQLPRLSGACLYLSAP